MVAQPPPPNHNISASLNTIDCLNGVGLQGKGMLLCPVDPMADEIELGNINWRRKKAQSSHGQRFTDKTCGSSKQQQQLLL